MQRKKHTDTLAAVLFGQSPQDLPTGTYQDRVHPSVDSAETHQGGKHHSRQQPQNKGILSGGEEKTRRLDHAHVV